MNDYQSYNAIILIGRIGQDPELKRTKGKYPQDFVKFSVATYRKYKNGKKITTWTQCSYWGDSRAAWATQYVKKGMLMRINGHLETRKWVTPDGSPRKVTEINVDSIGFVGSEGRIDLETKPEEEEKKAEYPTAEYPDQDPQGDPGMGQITDEEEDAQPAAEEDDDFF